MQSSSGTRGFNNLLTSTVGPIPSDFIQQAVLDNRVVVGLDPALAYLNENVVENANQVLFGVLLTSTESDVHMQNTLLQAYFTEQKIDIIRIDSAENLARMLNTNKPETCVLILRKNRQGKRLIARCCELTSDNCQCGQSTAKKLESV